eukprot:c51494_g1_i1 orf=3-200(-)
MTLINNCKHKKRYKIHKKLQVSADQCQGLLSKVRSTKKGISNMYPYVIFKQQQQLFGGLPQKRADF